MDYEAAFTRERTARKKAESILEQKSRELHFANTSLKDNVDSLNLALRENKFLFNIGLYGIEKPKLRDFLPTIVDDMMNLSGIPFAMYTHFPFDPNQEKFYSALLVNSNLTESEGEGETSLDNDQVRGLAEEIEGIFQEKKDTHTQAVDLSINEQNIVSVIVLPIISLDHLSGMVMLFSDEADTQKTPFLTIFETGIKQLAIIMEHRYQEEKLIASYEEISATNKALKETQKKLVQSEKMATVGQLSAGIAHEINNPMGFIKSNMSSLSDYIEDFISYVETSKTLMESAFKVSDEGVSNHANSLNKIWKEVDMPFLIEDSQNLLNESQQGVVRIIDIVGGLKRFSRQSDHKKEPCELGNLLDEALKLASNELKFKGEIIKNVGEVPLINVNSGEMLQVFLNLFVNASHAMDEQGELTIEASEENKGVSIRVTDNGCGIEEKYLKSIFDPFFTTKDVGTGTGLGLSISYGIIEDHQGTIAVQSELGKGTTFHIWLPLEANG